MRYPKPVRTRALAVALVVLALLLVVMVVAALPRVLNQVAETPSAPGASNSNDQTIARAYENRQSGIQVAGEGVVERLLSDDNEGGRHQRFIVRLESGQTLLVAHNIDVAPRLDALATGDTVAFFGVYEWNDEGGVIHWTHHDPAGQHVAGWLRHEGETYQ